MIDAERRKRVVETMRSLGVDAFVCASDSEVLLLTGYWPVMGDSVVIFTAAGEIRLLLPEDEVELAVKSSEASLTPYKPAELRRIIRPIEALSQVLGPVLSQLGLGKATIGVQVDQGMQPAAYISNRVSRSSLLDLLRNLLPGARFIASDDALEEMKSRKTPAELQQMCKAAEIAAAGFEMDSDALEGKREAEVAAEMQSAFQRSPKAAAVERSYGAYFCMSGPNSARASAAYARTRQRRIERGDLVMIHANTCADGYWTDITRTYTAGEPKKRQQAMRAAVNEAKKMALAEVRPGVSARDVDCAARNVMVAHGFGDAFKHSTGHGVGFAAANGNALPRIHPQSPDVLDVGMTFNIEPAAYFDGYGGMRHCDVIAVTTSGAEILTNF